MGFEKDLTRIARAFSRQTPKQSVRRSATFPAGVLRLAADYLAPQYYCVSVGRVWSPQASLRQRFAWVDVRAGGRHRRGYDGQGHTHGVHDHGHPKVGSVVRSVQEFWRGTPKKDQASVIVFTNAKDGAETYGRALASQLGNKRGTVRVIHGDK